MVQHNILEYEEWPMARLGKVYQIVIGRQRSLHARTTVPESLEPPAYVFVPSWCLPLRSREFATFFVALVGREHHPGDML